LIPFADIWAKSLSTRVVSKLVAIFVRAERPVADSPNVELLPPDKNELAPNLRTGDPHLAGGTA
jgi:hypothetical protein